MDKKGNSLRKTIITVAVTAIVTVCITTWIPDLIKIMYNIYYKKNNLIIRVYRDKEAQPVRGVQVEIWPAGKTKVNKAYHYETTSDNGIVQYSCSPDEPLLLEGKLKDKNTTKKYVDIIPNNKSVTDVKWDIGGWAGFYDDKDNLNEINKSKEKADRITTSPWMNIALAEIGTKEFMDEQSNPRIIEYLHSINKEANSDKIPWPSAFVNWVITESGLQGNNSLSARSWLSWGQGISDPVFGAITILQGHSPASGMVGFYLGPVDDDSIKLLGGNINNQVIIAIFPKSRVLGYRWPK